MEEKRGSSSLELAAASKGPVAIDTVDALPSPRRMMSAPAHAVDGYEHEHNLSTLFVTRKVLFNSAESNVMAFNRTTRELVKQYTKHGMWVTALEYFNFVLYTASQDHNIMSWSIKTGQSLHTYKGHAAAVTQLKIAPLGKDGLDRLFSSSWDGTVRAWSLFSGRLVQTFSIGSKPVEQFIVRDGLLYAGCGDSLRIFNTDTRERLFNFRGQQEKLHHCIAFDQNLEKLITAGTTVSVWNLRQDEIKADVLEKFGTPGPPQRRPNDESKQDPDDEMNSDFIPSPKPLVTSPSSAERQRYRNTDKVNHIVLGDGRFWTGHADGSVRAWDSVSQKLLKTMRAHKGPITSMVIYKNMLCTGATDRAICIWDARSDQLLRVLKGHKDEITSLKKFRGLLYSGSLDGDVRTWDLLDNAEFTGVYKGSACRVKAMTLGRGIHSNKLFFCNDGGFVACWDTEKCELWLEWKVSDHSCESLLLVDSKLYVGTQNSVHVYDVDFLKEKENKENDDDFSVRDPGTIEKIPVEGLVTSLVQDGDTIYAASSSQILGEITQIHLNKNEASSFNISAKGGHAAGTIRLCMGDDEVYSCCKGDKQMIVWSKSGEIKKRVPLSEAGTACAYSDFGGHRRVFVAVGHEGGQDEGSHIIIAFDADTHEELYRCDWHTNAIQDLTTKGGYLFAASMDECISVWTIRDGALYHVIRCHDHAVWCLACGDDLMLHSGSYKVFSTEMSTFETFGIEIDYRAKAGRGGLFGKPIELEEVKLEKDRIHREQKSGGTPKSRRPTMGTASEAVLGDTEMKGVSAFSDLETDVREAHSAQAKQKRKFYEFFDLFFLGFVIVTVDLLQHVSFAFTLGMGINSFDSRAVDANRVQTAAWNNDALVDFFQGVQTFTPGTNFDATFAFACVFVFFMWGGLVFQEALEWQKFLFPSNRTVSRFWRIARFTIKFMAITFFMPVLSAYVLAFACSRSSQSDNEWAWDADVTIKCYEDVHLVRCILAGAAICFYVPPALRLIRVGTELRNLEIVGNPLDWRMDHTSEQYVSPASVASTIPDILSLFVKAGYVVAAVSLTNKVETQAVLNFAFATVLAVSVFVFPPYYSERMNRFRASAYVGIAWVHLAAVVYHEQNDTESTIASQMCIALVLIIPLVYAVFPFLSKAPQVAPWLIPGELIFHGRLGFAHDARRSILMAQPSKKTFRRGNFKTTQRPASEEKLLGDSTSV